MSKKLDRFNPDYPYKKEGIDTGVSAQGHPIVERKTNGLLYPESPKNLLDMDQMNDFE